MNAKKNKSNSSPHRKIKKDLTPRSLEPIEAQLTNIMLASSLALKILRDRRKPVSELVSELLEIEYQVGQFIGDAMKAHISGATPFNFNGVLANAISMIPMGMAMSSKTASKKNKSRKKKSPTTKK